MSLQVEEQLVKRLYTAIAAWTASLTSYGHDAPAHHVGEEGAETRAMRPKLEVSVCYRQRCMWMCPTPPTVLQCIACIVLNLLTVSIPRLPGHPARVAHHQPGHLPEPTS